MKLKNICLASLCVVMLTGCSDSFLENVPQGSLSDGVMNSPEAIDLLVNAAYASLYGMTNEQGDPCMRPVTNWSYGEVRADNAYKGGGGEGDVWDVHAMETFQIQSNNWNIDGKWFNLYSLISRCNSALRVLNECDGSVVKEKDIRIAEMKVLRAHHYFELVRLFNKVPYIDENLPTTEYVDVPNDQYTREEHLQRIAADLLDAAKNIADSQSEGGSCDRYIVHGFAV